MFPELQTTTELSRRADDRHGLMPETWNQVPRSERSGKLKPSIIRKKIKMAQNWGKLTSEQSLLQMYITNFGNGVLTAEPWTHFWFGVVYFLRLRQLHSSPYRRSCLGWPNHPHRTALARSKNMLGKRSSLWFVDCKIHLSISQASHHQDCILYCAWFFILYKAFYITISTTYFETTLGLCGSHICHQRIRSS